MNCIAGVVKEIGSKCTTQEKERYGCTKGEREEGLRCFMVVPKNAPQAMKMSKAQQV